MEDLVSIITPSYNTAKYIADTIRSVLSQTYQNWEMIIVDDCSTDDTDEVVATFLCDKRIRYLKNAQNSGAAVSRNYAIREARGKWIAFLDSDDLWLPDKLERQISFMNERVAAFSCTSYWVKKEGEKQLIEYSPKRDSYGYKDILKHCRIGCSTVIYDVDCLGKVYMPTNAPKREDFACWLEILKRGTDVLVYHDPLTTYLVHTYSVSSKKSKMIKYQWHVYRKIENLSWIKSIFYLTNWAIKGLLKYR